ncbi:hypothetical protein [Flagellimonas marinaquae]|uniref:hypothetical protein n=1 Tax=Flagellimonas marinaquae TaxID=254955 RepID=UPI000F8F0127|nr:hypothetical protein [Allomuricauda aquimarina]
METNGIATLWKKYNFLHEQLKVELGRTSNLTGEYAEYLINAHLRGDLLKPSTHSADIIVNDLFYQVKSRRTSKTLNTQLGIIRSWDFDFLAVVLFDNVGKVLKAMLYPKETVLEYAKKNRLQNGWVLSMTRQVLDHKSGTDITQSLRKINQD